MQNISVDLLLHAMWHKRWYDKVLNTQSSWETDPQSQARCPSSYSSLFPLTTPSSSTTLALVIITPGPGRIQQARPLCTLTKSASGPLAQLEPLLALRVHGLSSTCMGLVLRGGYHSLLGRRLRRAAHRAPRERELVGAGAVVYPRNWIPNQVGKESTTLTAAYSEADAIINLLYEL